MSGGAAWAMNWYLIHDAWVCVPPKNGSTSFKVAVCGQTSSAHLRKWAREHDAGPVSQLPPDSRPRYLAVRDPESRFASLWRSCQHENYHGQSFVMEYGLFKCNPSVLMDVIEKHSNQHWEPQVSWYSKGVTPIPYHEFLGIVGLPHRWENETHGNPPFLPEYRIKHHYSRDYDLWAMALDFQA